MAQKKQNDRQDETRGDVPYQVVARRFRPKAFDEVVGQDVILQSLRTALQQQRIPHAFLFAGSRGVGKTTLARILARCLDCELGPTPEPCGKCALCRSILEGSNTDVVEIDAASYRRIDDMRKVIESVGFASMRSRYRVFILDEAHMLTKEAFNALLKTLEEPPPKVVFVLATTELHKVPETIRSRCQVHLFQRIGDAAIVQRLRMIAQQDGVAVPDQVLAEIAATVRGGMRDAETALERVLPIARELGDKFDLAAWHELVQRTGAERSLEVVGALLRGEAAAAMHFAAELQQNGADEREALGELVETLRSLLLLQVDGPDTGLVTATGAVRAQLQALAAAAQPQQIDAMIQAAVLGRDRLRRLEDRGVVLELTLVRMAQAGTLPLLADLLAELRAGTAGPVPAPAARPAGALPRPAATPASSAPAAAAGADLRTRVLARIADKPLLHATLELCRIQGPDPQHKVVLTLDSDRKLHRDRLAAPPVRQQVTALIQDVVGRKVTVDFQLGAPAAEAVPPVVPPGPATRAAIERFGGRVVATDPAERVRREAGDTGSKEAGSSDADPEPAPPAPDDGDR